MFFLFLGTARGLRRASAAHGALGALAAGCVSCIFLPPFCLSSARTLCCLRPRSRCCLAPLRCRPPRITAHHRRPPGDYDRRISLPGSPPTTPAHLLIRTNRRRAAVCCAERPAATPGLPVPRYTCTCASHRPFPRERPCHPALPLQRAHFQRPPCRAVRRLVCPWLTRRVIKHHGYITSCESRRCILARSFRPNAGGRPPPPARRVPRGVPPRHGVRRLCPAAADACVAASTITGVASACSESSIALAGAIRVLVVEALTP